MLLHPRPAGQIITSQFFSSYHLRRRRRDFHRVGRDAAGSDSGHGFAQGLLGLRDEQSNFTSTFISFSCAEKELLCSF